jgi:hypothetical protein
MVWIVCAYLLIVSVCHDLSVAAASIVLTLRKNLVLLLLLSLMQKVLSREGS